MKRLILLLMSWALLAACASHTSVSEQQTTESTESTPNQCTGEVTAPAVFAPMLTEVDRPELVTAALGASGVGGLCQAKAYLVSQEFDIYRAWNSQNPYSQFGHWWAFSIPSGKISEYRRDYAICPKFSPLDMLIKCNLKEGSVVVLGTGQSATCNANLNYPTSSTIQIYIADAAESTEACQSYYGVFSWQNVDKKVKTRPLPEMPADADDSF